MAEKERVKNYINVLQVSGIKYYKIIQRMIIRDLPKTEVLSQFANYMKSVIENGINFESKHFIYIIKDIGVNKMTQEEIL